MILRIFKTELDKHCQTSLFSNNLVSEKPEEVAGKMNDLIKSLKGNARMIAISGVIKRYDNRVQASKISHFNHLVKNLCANHNATFFNNDHIDRSLLNRSNLHLNREGDRALGSVFCSYLKSSVRVRTAGNSLHPTGNRNSSRFFHQAHGHRDREWKMYLRHVNQTMK